MGFMIRGIIRSSSSLTLALYSGVICSIVLYYWTRNDAQNQQPNIDLLSTASNLYEWFTLEEGKKLVWGLIARGVGFVWGISLIPIAVQIKSLHGKHSHDPYEARLDHLWSIWPSWKCVWFHPTVFWWVRGDFAIQAVPFIGGVCGILAALGGLPQLGLTSQHLLIFCWIAALNIDKVMHMLYPWDALLLESGFLSMFLPAAQPLLPVLGDMLRKLANGNFDDMPSSDAWISGLSLTDTAPPILNFMFRWLLFRLMYGFGKLKFSNTTEKDWLYIKYFMINMPMTSPLGFFGYFLPRVMHVLMLVLMWLAEIPGPFMFLWGGRIGLIGAFGIICLQVGIQTTGNFGYFNILTAILALAGLDHSTSFIPWAYAIVGNLNLHIFDRVTNWLWVSVYGTLMSLCQQVYLHVPTVLQHAFEFITVTSYGLFHIASRMVCGPSSPPNLSFSTISATEQMLVIFLLFITIPASLNILFNSWCSMGWMYWPGWYKLRPSWLWNSWFGYLRAIAAFRLNHAYGVFPPNSSPGVRWCPVYEGSYDHTVWRQYKWRYMLTEETDAPGFVAPHHPRIDHAIFYESFGGNGHGFTHVLGGICPLLFSRATPWRRLQSVLLRGSDDRNTYSSPSSSVGIFSNNPFPNPQNPPASVRCSLYLYRPAPAMHALSTGEWWLKEHSGTHLPAMADFDKDEIWHDWLVPPECFHFDSVIARERIQWTSQGVSEEAYEDVWSFISCIRQAAAEVGVHGVSSAHTTPVKPSRKNRSRSNTRRGSSISVRRRHQAPEDIDEKPDSSSSNGYDDKMEDINTSTAAEHWSSALRSVEIHDGLDQLSIDASLTAEQAARLFNFVTLSGVWRAIKRQYDVNELRRLEHAFCVMAAPLVAHLTALYLRPTPTKADVEAELLRDHRLRRTNSDLAPDNLWEVTNTHTNTGVHISDDLYGGKYWKSYTSPRQSTPETRQVADAFQSGNASWEELYRMLPTVIDQPIAGPASDAAYMCNAFRIGCYAHWLMLVGGRKMYERAVGGMTKVVGGHRLPLVWPLKQNSRPWTTTASAQQLHADTSAEKIYSMWEKQHSSLPHVFRVTNTPKLNVSKMTLQSGMFIQSLFHFQSIAFTATKERIMSRIVRPENSQLAGGILPGVLEAVIQLKDTPDLRMWDNLASDWVQPLIAPTYDHSKLGTAWVEESDGSDIAHRPREGNDVVTETEVQTNWSEAERSQWRNGTVPSRVRTDLQNRRVKGTYM